MPDIADEGGCEHQHESFVKPDQGRQQSQGHSGHAESDNALNRSGKNKRADNGREYFW